MTIEPRTVTHPMPGRTLPALMRAGRLDAELAALAWTALEGRIPLLVAGSEGSPGEPDPASELAAAFVPFLPDSAGRATLGESAVEGDPGRDIVVAGRLTGGDLRRAVRGVGRGFGLVAAVSGGSLADVLEGLRAMPIGATEAAIGRLGIILVTEPELPHRVAAAHYLRPEVRDAGGHLRWLAPAVLVTWDAGHGRFDHFGWAVYPELAERTGRRAGDVEREHGERTAWLDHMASARHGETAADLAAALAARARSAIGPGRAAH